MGYGPSDLQTAYKLMAASAANGAAQTIAIVDAYDNPNAEADLAVYRSTFSLPPCTTANGCFMKVNQSGMTTPAPGTDPTGTGGWEVEESLDLDMASAICPNCELVLVEANDPNSLFTAEDTAATTCAATVISNSWDGGEFNGETTLESHFNHPGVMITVSSGDNGYNNSMDGYPVSSQYVTAVGGTTLNNPSPGVFKETVWSGSGSDCSLYIAQPAWQMALGSSITSVCSMRIANDVSAEADPNTGVAVYDTFGGSMGCTTWCVFGGTSAAAPIIAGVYAVAGNGGSINAGSWSYSHLGGVTDITSGSNGTCSGTYLCNGETGYDAPTGNGSPNGISGF